MHAPPVRAQPAGAAASAMLLQLPVPVPGPGSAPPTQGGGPSPEQGLGGWGLRAPTDGPVSLLRGLLPTEELSGTFPTVAVGLCADGGLGVEPYFYFAT